MHTDALCSISTCDTTSRQAPVGPNGGGPVIVQPSGVRISCRAATASGGTGPGIGGSLSNDCSTGLPVASKNDSNPAGLMRT